MFVRGDKATFPAHRDGGKNIVTCNHHFPDTGALELVDDTFGLRLQLVLEDDKPNKVEVLLCIRTLQLVASNPTKLWHIFRCTTDNSVATVCVVGEQLIVILWHRLCPTDIPHAFRCSFDIDIPSLCPEVPHYNASPSQGAHELKLLADCQCPAFGGIIRLDRLSAFGPGWVDRTSYTVYHTLGSSFTIRCIDTVYTFTSSAFPFHNLFEAPICEFKHLDIQRIPNHFTIYHVQTMASSHSLKHCLSSRKPFSILKSLSAVSLLGDQLFGECE